MQGAKDSTKWGIAFFERAIFENLGRLTLRRSVSLRFRVFCFFLGARPPVHFGDLKLTGSKKRVPLETLCDTTMPHARDLSRNIG